MPLADEIHSEPARISDDRPLSRYLGFLGVLVALYAVLFHLINLYVEGEHSWVTGLYWTLVVMTTLGFGDITFTSDTGRDFSIIVLLSGVVFLLVMLPFLFIRLFYAPWLDRDSAGQPDCRRRHGGADRDAERTAAAAAGRMGAGAGHRRRQGRAGGGEGVAAQCT